MVNRSLTDLSALSAQQVNGTGSPIELEFYSKLIFFIFTTLLSSFGILGNGMVIWLLGFCIKRSPFTTYVLNLALADFGFLTILIMAQIYSLLPQTFMPLDNIKMMIDVLFNLICFSQFSTSQYLLTVISIDRCVSVFFPVWHRCHRPTKLTLIVCALIWVISFLPSAICLIGFRSGIIYTVFQFQLIINGLLCLPFMIISSLMIFIKVCCKSKQQRRRKLLISILVAVSFFCFLSLPLNILYAIIIFSDVPISFIFAVIFCACLNSSVNPLIYYLVGRPRKGRSNKSMKVVLQKLFKEEEI